MATDLQILQLLAKAGSRGLTCKMLAKHIYNANNSLFEAASFADIYRDTHACLVKMARQKDPFIEKTGQWGYYRINKENIERAQNFPLNFLDYEEESDTPNDTPTISPDIYPSLFD